MGSLPEIMTNRELHTNFERVGVKNLDRMRLVSEMAKRLRMLKELAADPSEENVQKIIQEFKHWKLNGAGNQTW